MYEPYQWETTLQCNLVSHWLGAYTKWSLVMSIIPHKIFPSFGCVLFCSRLVFCLLLWVSSDYAQPITGQVTEVTCPVIGWAQPERTPTKWQKTGPGHITHTTIKREECALFEECTVSLGSYHIWVTMPREELNRFWHQCSRDYIDGLLH